MFGNHLYMCWLVTLLYPEIRARWESSRQIIAGRCSWKNCHIPRGTGDHNRRKILCRWSCVGSYYVWWLGNFCIPPCPWIFVTLLHSSLSMNFCNIVAFLLVRCISSLWDDDAEFCHMMYVNCGFLWIWMPNLISVNLVISWLVPGCSPWWLPNPGRIQDAADNHAAGYCRGGIRICNGR
jgi:hypothetical protein